MYVLTKYDRCEYGAENSILAGLFGAVGNIASTASANHSNEKIAQETNATNLAIARETNAMQVEESEKAYQRSTPEQQIANLTAVGLSEQQARQVVANSGAAAAYTPATLTPGQVQPYQMLAPDVSGIGSGLSVLSESIKSPDGGVIGQSIFNEVLNDLYSLPEFDPMAMQTIPDFEAYANATDKDGNLLHPEAFGVMSSDNYQKCRGSILGKRAWNNHFGTFMAAKNQYLGFARELIALDQDSIDAMRNQLELDDYTMIRDCTNEYNLKHLQRSLELFEFVPEHNEEYMQAHLKMMLENDLAQGILYQTMHYINEHGLQALQTNPALKQFLGVYKLLDTAGVWNNNITAVIGSLVASGYDVLPKLAQLADELFPLASSLGELVGSGARLATSVTNAVTSGFEWLDEKLHPDRPPKFVPNARTQQRIKSWIDSHEDLKQSDPGEYYRQKTKFLNSL